MDNESTSMDSLRRQIDITTRASMGIIAIRCPVTEVFRVVETIYLAARSNGSAFRMWSMLTGWAQYEEDIVSDLASLMDGEEKTFNPIKPYSEDKSAISYATALQKIADDDRDIRQYPDDCYYVMIDAHHYLEEPQMEAAIRRQAQRAYDSDQRLFMVMPETASLPDNIAPFLHLIEYEYPKLTELRMLFDLMIENLEPEHQPDFSENEKRTICRNGLGMSKTAFENALALSITDWHQDASHNGETPTPVSFDHVCCWIRQYKTEALRKTEVLELQEPVGINQIGGLQNYKEWMEIRRLTYEANAIAQGITPSRGVLVLGVPGTGKSLIAKAAGAQLDLPVIRFDIGRVFGSYVGQSESKMRSALKLIDAMAPLVLMVDEVDKGFAGTARGGNNDSGTSMRVFGTFLTWMQERKQSERPVFIVFTANRVHGLPPELMRKGRLDELWAVNSPNRDEREEIVRIHAKKRKLRIIEDEINQMVTHSDGLVGAEIESIVEQCLIRAYQEGHTTLTLKNFLKERQYLKPLKESFAEDFRAIEEWGRTHARIASAEPKTYNNVRKVNPAKRPSLKKAPDRLH
jgi:SpoVK/Ycf46/Vps4 family AAA+-type ATPase